VQINHGMAEHAARYERFAGFLATRGYLTYAHDHRGHGATTAPDAPLGTYATKDGWQKVLEDVAAVNAHIKDAHPGLPIICFGHSMGATIALAYAEVFPDTINGLAVWNSGQPGFMASILRQVLKIERMFKGSDVPSTMAGKATFEAFNSEFKPNRTDFDWLSRDEAEVDKYVADPLCGFPVSIQMWLDFLAGLNTAATSAAFNQLSKSLPVHLVSGAKDPCSSHAKATLQLGKSLSKAGLSNITTTVLENTRHESLNEINREETMANFADWLDSAVAN